MPYIETERKFLVSGDFKSCSFSSTHIIQGYICSASGRTVRVRVRDDKGYITIKGPVKGISRFEWEKEIPVDEAEILMQLCETAVIDKTRYLVKNTDGVHTWEVDEFHGANEGLVEAEIELSVEGESFDRPSWLGEEVTGDRKYYNSSLTKNPYKDWRK